MGYIVQLEDKNGNKQYPVTTLDLVIDSNGETAKYRLTKIDDTLNKLTKITDKISGDKTVDGSIDNKIYKAIVIGSMD